MKKIIMISAAVSLIALLACQDYSNDKPIDYKRLPSAVQAFVDSNYSDVDVLYATKDDDLILPDYTVMLKNGVKLQFGNSGELESIKVREGAVPVGIVPAMIEDYVRSAYPEAFIKEYELDRNSYEVKLSNRLEIKFNRNFQVVEIDD